MPERSDSYDQPARDVRLLGAAEVRRLAELHGVRPTKQRGQNFVVDGNTVRRIVRTAGLAADDVVVEVGPGLGSLTLALLEVVERVVAIEIDDALATTLAGTVADRAPGEAHRLEVLHADALRVETLPAVPTALVANLPYNVSVPVLLHLLGTVPSLRSGLVMVQSEVADRLCATPGGRTYGVPSVKTAWYARARPAGNVARSVFWPVPNVDSGLVSLVRREPPATSAARDEVFAVIDAGFAQRRKTLRGALARLAGSPDAAERALLAAGIGPRSRAEELGVEQFAAIAEALPRDSG